MKKSIFIFSTALAAFGFQSCTDDDLTGSTPVQPGTEIRFGAVLDSNGDDKSRTVYGDSITENGKTIWPIYWNYSGTDTGLDSIYIYTPQGAGVRNQAPYVVKPDHAGMATAAQITKLGAYGVQAGDGTEPYNFYGVYPASAVKERATGDAVFTLHLSAEQDVTHNNLPSAPVVGSDVVYNMIPDMKCCLMLAENKNVTISADDSVNLLFTPFSSVLDITIPGLAETNTVTGKSECAVTSVVIDADKPIAGDVIYDFSDGSLKFDAATSSNRIVVQTRGLDPEGNLVGVPLAMDNTLRLQAFLLPNPEVESIKVTVYTSDMQVWTKTLTMTNNGQPLFVPKQIHKVRLPRLNFKEGAFDYSMWLSQLDPRIYLSEISLPGSTSSFSKSASGTSQLQTLDITQQFRAGIRVFRCHIWLYDEDSPLEDLEVKRPSFGINVNGGSNIMPLVTAVRTLYKEMETNHSDEFCVLMVADYSSGGYSFKEFYERFKVITDRMAASGYTPDHIDANTTIGDVKGKVILKLQLNADGGDDSSIRPNNVGGAFAYDGINALFDKIGTWSNVNGSKALLNWWTSMNGQRLFYAPMTFGNVGSFTYSPFSEGSGGRGSATQTSPGLAADAALMLASSAQRPLSNWFGNCNVTSVPSDFDDPSKIWYVYGAQAKPDNYTQYTNSFDMIEAATNAIKTNYKTGGATIHNKFFMTYLGGAGSYRNATRVTEAFVPEWNTQTSESNFGKDRPFGWVLFNHIPDPAIADADLTATADILVRNAIKRVISRNNDMDFKLERDRSKSVTPAKAAPTGDVQGTPAKGSIF